MHFIATILLLLMASGCSAKVVENDNRLRYEEYIVEHEVSATEARKSLKSRDPKSLVPSPGCQSCTADEIKYCLGSDVIQDHCCCDKRYYEYFAYIPHTCYLGSQLCKTVAQDCDEYTRIRVCCCDKYALIKWKEKSSSSTRTKKESFSLFLGCITIVIVNIFVK